MHNFCRNTNSGTLFIEFSNKNSQLAGYYLSKIVYLILAMFIYLIRHGQTTGDIEDRYGGDYDDDLTKLGRTQSERLAKSLQKAGIETIYASPLKRAKQTATILSTQLSIPLEVIEGFKERNSYGVLTGLIKSEALERYTDQVSLLDDVHNTIQGGESYETFKKRITHALSSIIQDQSANKRLGLVTHGGPITLIFREILGRGEVKVGDCGYALLEARENDFIVHKLKGIEPK